MEQKYRYFTEKLRDIIFSFVGYTCGFSTEMEGGERSVFSSLRKSVGTYIHINAIKQLMQRQMHYIRCNKAIHNTYDAMKQNITNKT